MLVNTQDQTLNSIIAQLKSKSAASEPSWLQAYRRDSLKQFETLGIPTVKDEEWKYTNVSSLASRKLALPQTAAASLTDELHAYINDPIVLVYVNGVFSKAQSKCPNTPGLRATCLRESFADKTVERYFTKYAADSQTPFQALNSVLCPDGSFIYVEKKAVVKPLIHIVHITTEAETFQSPRSLIVLEESAQARVLESHLSLGTETAYVANPLTDIFLSENAVLTYCKVQNENSQAVHIGNTRVWQERNSNYEGFSLLLGSLLNRNNLDIILNGEGINSTLNGLYCLHGKQHVDNHTSVDHRQPNCVSNQLYKGILNEASRAVFNGKIFVRPIAQKTNSYQLNKNLLLGKDARVDTKPQLEIFADDVKCTHGATIGQLNEDEMFYLQSRCVGRQMAARMLAQGFVDDVVDRINAPSIQDKLHHLLIPTFERI